MTIALSSKPEIRTRLDYATLLHQTGDLRQAVAQLRQVVLLEPDSVEALNNLGWLLATAPDDTLRDGVAAVQYAERASKLPPVKEMCVPGTLAAAYAEAGRFPEAVATAERAIKLETDAGETRFANINQQLFNMCTMRANPSANRLQTTESNNPLTSHSAWNITARQRRRDKRPFCWSRWDRSGQTKYLSWCWCWRPKPIQLLNQQGSHSAGCCHWCPGRNPPH